MSALYTELNCVFEGPPERTNKANSCTICWCAWKVIEHTLLCTFDSVWIDGIIHWTKWNISCYKDSERCLSLWTVMWTPHEMNLRLKSFSTNETIKAKSAKCYTSLLDSRVHFTWYSFSLSTHSLSPYQILHVTGDVQRGQEEERQRVNWMTWNCWKHDTEELHTQDVLPLWRWQLASCKVQLLKC